jgi:hypothetical protein
MNIKNHTSGRAVETTISRIEAKLAAIGATHIMKMFGPDKKISAIFFNMPDGARSFAVRLPANVHACFEAMWSEHVKRVSRWSPATKANIYAQAERTAWKLVQEWIEIQVSMVLMRQAEALQVFLPYIWDGKQTHFEHIKAGGFKALPEVCGG